MWRVYPWPSGWQTPRPPALPPIYRDYRDPRVDAFARRCSATCEVPVSVIEWSNRDVRLPAHVVQIVWGSQAAPTAAVFNCAVDQLASAVLAAAGLGSVAGGKGGENAV